MAKSSRPRSVARTRLSVLLALAGLALAAVLAPRPPLADWFGRQGEAAEWLADLAAEAEWDAVAARPPFELRRRFRDKVAECAGVTLSSFPLRLEERPGRILLRHERDARPMLEIDFLALKREGLRGDFSLRRDSPSAPPEAGQAVLMAGLLGVHAPDRPCPPLPEPD